MYSYAQYIYVSCRSRIKTALPSLELEWNIYLIRIYSWHWDWSPKVELVIYWLLHGYYSDNLGASEATRQCPAVHSINHISPIGEIPWYTISVRSISIKWDQFEDAKYVPTASTWSILMREGYVLVRGRAMRAFMNHDIQNLLYT